MQKTLYCFVSILIYIISINTLISNATSTIHAAPPTQKKIAYTVRFNSPDVPELAVSMKEHSQLVQLIDQPPNSKLGLNLRIKEDLDIGKKLLYSNGYYNGSVTQHIDWNTNPLSIEIQFIPGIQYKIGITNVQYKNNTSSELPNTLTQFDLSPNMPAIAADVLLAIENLVEYLHNHGYPLANLSSTRYSINRIEHNLDVCIDIEQGPLLYMGKVEPHGIPNISKSYLNKIIPWKEGKLWNNARIISYRNRLQQTGLFASITLKPGETPESNGNTPIELIATEAPTRTISGGVKYSSDQGLGVRGTWEHRNVFGNGENFRLTAPISKDDQQLIGTFRKPAFGYPNQAFISEAKILNEKTDAYNQQLVSVAAGLERQLNKRWWATASSLIETGFVDDQISPKKIFTLFGIPMTIKRDTSDNPLNPTKGTKSILAMTPYIGKYRDTILTLRSHFDFSAYLDLFKNEKLILAGKISLGSLLGQHVEKYPAILRFYAGGGGSVRGYDYQSLGPKNRRGDPIGGLSFSTVSFELRVRLTDVFGLVPFIDGGNIYEKQFPNLTKTIYWGTGIGFRYYSSISPIRLDIATPLQNRKHNKSIQIYISIGQAF